MTPLALAESYIRTVERDNPTMPPLDVAMAALLSACKDQGRGFNRFSPSAVPPLKLDTEKGL